MDAPEHDKSLVSSLDDLSELEQAQEAQPVLVD
jgi:hypothetical protein